LYFSLGELKKIDISTMKYLTETMDTPFYTPIVYKNDIECVCNNGSYSVVAKKPIAMGSIVLIEHVLSGTVKHLTAIVENCPHLYDELYPRGSGERKFLAKRKVLVNSFGDGDDRDLGLFASKLNHSCDPNVVVECIPLQSMTDDHTTTLLVVLAVKDICCNEEIVMCYKPLVGHEECQLYGFKCNCGKTVSERLNAYTAMPDKAREIIDTNQSSLKDTLKTLKDAYTNTQVFTRTLVFHESAKYGLYVASVQDNKFIPTSRFLKAVKRAYGKGKWTKYINEFLGDIEKSLIKN